MDQRDAVARHVDRSQPFKVLEQTRRQFRDLVLRERDHLQQTGTLSRLSPADR